MLARGTMNGSDIETVRIFYSYSRKDEKQLEALDEILGSMKWDVVVAPWHDSATPPGNPWNDEIHLHLTSAHIILLFISNNFLKSQFCYEIEMPLAMERHERGEARVIPIILEDTTPNWRRAPFAKLQVLPQNGQPIDRWDNRTYALRKVAQGIFNIVGNHGFSPHFKQKWELHLETHFDAFTAEEEFQIVKRLRDLSGDNSVRPIDVRAGGVVLIMESTQDAFFKIKEYADADELSALLGWNVRRIVERFGAGIHASMNSENTRGITPSSIPPDPDLLLFPTGVYKECNVHAFTVPKKNPLSSLLQNSRW